MAQLMPNEEAWEEVMRGGGDRGYPGCVEDDRFSNRADYLEAIRLVRLSWTRFLCFTDPLFFIQPTSKIEMTRVHMFLLCYYLKISIVVLQSDRKVTDRCGSPGENEFYMCTPSCLLDLTKHLIPLLEIADCEGNRPNYTDIGRDSSFEEVPQDPRQYLTNRMLDDIRLERTAFLWHETQTEESAHFMSFGMPFNAVSSFLISTCQVSRKATQCGARCSLKPAVRTALHL